MPCLAETNMKRFCELGQKDNPAYCHAEQQAAADLAILEKDSSLVALSTPGALETDIRTSFHGCGQLEKVIAGIKAELERRQAHQRGEQFPL